ncbi:glycosyltransferase family 4 protein [Antarcticirhabdus aurantiaca]|uniref:Glycosyltransferase family 4 protein n=1 Tax=Antarcticirhabdus aurantiaca TaxID=2606717 RepID=A0ACD4NM26_9HYPH|nr:glycosyltransferase family 4 protein [Antarcticirhabdus aurantiaca]WAJ27955.1 glycosyltransferase family 4 protein [Jeongeuplla avenae]
MRVLISAYACEPGAGSELGKGWNFSCELARQGHEVTVLTCGSHHRDAIERHAAAHGLPEGLRFAWHDVPGWSGPGYANARHIRQHYLAWQLTVRRTAAALLARAPFDVVHHLTWTVLRWPSFLGGLGPRFVFGPVGGGQGSPKPLRKGLPRRCLRAERRRDAINLWSRVDPLVLGALSRADAILVTDAATLRHVPVWLRGRAHVVVDVTAPPARRAIERPAREDPAILFAGRLEGWKGVHLALGAVARLRRHRSGLVFTVAGSGPEEAYFRAEAARLGLGEAVRFLGAVPHEAMGAVYAAHDLLLFPSLHDSGPHVIGEAFAHGLPVVCLDLGGPAIAVTERCGAVVKTGGRSRSDVEAALAEAVDALLVAPEALERARLGAFERAEALGYPAHVEAIVERFYQTPRAAARRLAAMPNGPIPPARKA